MAPPRTPGIRHVTDDIRNRQKNTILSAHAVGLVFTGATLSGIDNNFDTYITPGVVRINGTTVTGTKPPITDCTGYLVNYHPNTDVDADGTKVRQVFYPDSTAQPAPYTRVGILGSGDTHTWSNWSTLGGGLIHVKLTANATAIPNMLYYSFGNYTLTLPNPADFSLGTKVGVVQYLGTGSVVSHDAVSAQITEPIIDATDHVTVIGGQTYLFEICDGNNGGTPVHEWRLDEGDNVDYVVSQINTSIGELQTTLMAETQARQLAISEEAAARLQLEIALNTALNTAVSDLTTILNSKEKHTIYERITIPGTITTEMLTLAHYHYAIGANRTIVLPYRGDMPETLLGTTVQFDIAPEVTLTIEERNGPALVTQDVIVSPPDVITNVSYQFSWVSALGARRWTKVEVG